MTDDNTIVMHKLGVTRVQPPSLGDNIDMVGFRNNILADFYAKVCDRAEQNMAQTGTVSGAHWNAMRQILKEMGVEVTR